MGHHSTFKRHRLDSGIYSSNTMMWKLLTLLVVVSLQQIEARQIPDQQAMMEDRYDNAAVKMNMVDMAPGDSTMRGVTLQYCRSKDKSVCFTAPVPDYCYECRYLWFFPGK